MKRGFFKKLIMIYLAVQIIMMSSCFYEAKTGVRKVPIYSQKQNINVPEDSYEVTPIIFGDNLVIAVVSCEGGEKSKQKVVVEAIKSSFSIFDKNEDIEHQSVKFVSMEEILDKLSNEELESLDGKVEKKLNEEFGINTICSAEIIKDELKEKQLFIEVKEYNSGQAFSLIFEGKSWDLVGDKVAVAFAGSKPEGMGNSNRIKIENEILGYKIEPNEKQKIGKKSTFLIIGAAIIVILAVAISSGTDNGESRDPDSGGGHIAP